MEALPSETLTLILKFCEDQDTVSFLKTCSLIMQLLSESEKQIIKTRCTNVCLIPDPVKEEVAEIFKYEYVFKDSDKARKYFMKYGHLIDVDYDDGYLITKAAEQNDEELLKLFLARKPQSDLSNALFVARRDGYDGCVKLLHDYVCWVR